MKSSVRSGPLTHPSSVAPLEACREQRLGGSWEKHEGPSEVALQGTHTHIVQRTRLCCLLMSSREVRVIVSCA